jgi:catechol O-methyltransferase
MELFDDDDCEEGAALTLPQINPQIDRQCLLSQRPNTCGIVTFHNGIEDAMILFVERAISMRQIEAKDLPFEVLKAVDVYCYSRHWMMHIGDQKGLILDQTVQDLQCSDDHPINCVEIGSYCGYSAVRIAALFLHPLSRLYCIEREPKCVEWTRKLLTLAGLMDRVVLITGQCEDGIQYLQNKQITTVDFLFLDHDKMMYLPDLLTFESSGLLSPGCVVCADNVLSLGRPLQDYLNHVRGMEESEGRERGRRYVSSVLHRSCLEYSVADASTVPLGDYLEDGLEVSIAE